MVSQMKESRAGSLRCPRISASGWSGASVSSSRYSNGIFATSATQAVGARISRRTADADQESQLPQLPGLLRTAGKTVDHAPQAANAFDGCDHRIHCAPRMHDHRQIEIARQRQLAIEIKSAVKSCPGHQRKNPGRIRPPPRAVRARSIRPVPADGRAGAKTDTSGAGRTRGIILPVARRACRNRGHPCASIAGITWRATPALRARRSHRIAVGIEFGRVQMAVAVRQHGLGYAGA